MVRGRHNFGFLGSKITAVTALRLLLVLLVLWCELGIFSWSVSSCRWPDARHKKRAEYLPWKRVLLVADPQVLDHRSYPGRSWWLSRLTQFFVDFNLRKNWRVTRAFKPNVVIFLGDMTDGGRFDMSDSEYVAYVDRFKDIFRVPQAVDNYYLPGNHDVGLGDTRRVWPNALRHFELHFGPANQVVDINGHRLVFINAPDLVDEDYKRYAAGKNFEQWRGNVGGSIEFIKRISQERVSSSLILLSHIPLARPEGSDCGRSRERGTIHRGAGVGYQNLLGKETTKFLMTSLRPSLVFSGDDHDYCVYLHQQEYQHIPPVPEVTVKSFSMAMGIKRPGFQLLSLPPLATSGDASAEHQPCSLPNQIRIYTHLYLPAIALAIVYLFYYTFRNRNHYRHPPTRLSLDGSHHVPAPPWSAATDGDITHTDEEDTTIFEMPPLSSRSMLTASLIPHSAQSTPLGSPFIRATDVGIHGRFANNDVADFDGLDSASYLPVASSHSRTKSQTRAASWVDEWKKRDRTKQHRSWRQGLAGLLRWLRHPGRRRARSWGWLFIIDIVRTAWPPLLTYFIITVMIFW